MSHFKTLLLLTVLSLGMMSAASLLHPVPAATTGKYFDHVVTILMENNDLQSVLSQGTFQASLASQYTLSTGYSAVSHPSEPNYSALISGHISPNSDDGICCGQDSGSSIVDSLESHGLTWNAFAEGLTNADCSGRGIDTDHFPFLYFSDIVNNPARCANLLGASAKNDPELLNTLNAASGWPNYIWLTPDKKDDAHDTTIAFGDSYLAGIVPKILSSTLFTTQRTALFIVYDEGNDVACSSGGSDCVYASWSGSVTKKGFTSTNSYSHYSYLHTIEDNWGLPTLTSNDSHAPVMAEFFTTSTPTPLSTSFTISPGTAQVGQTVTFAASTTGGTPPYTDTWNFGDGSSTTGTTVTHTYSTAGTFQVTLTTRDSASPANTATSTKTLTISPATGTLSISISYSPHSPTAGQTVTFGATVTGGTAPYGVGWDFGDGAISVGLTTTHVFSTPGTFNVTAAVTDSATPAQTALTFVFVTVSSATTALSTTFTVSPGNAQVGQTVTFTATTSGGTPPYSDSWSFGDGTSGSGATVTHAYSIAGTFQVTLTTHDSASPVNTATSSKTLVISAANSLSISISYSPTHPSAGQTVTFAAAVTGGISPYGVGWDFGDGGISVGLTTTHVYPSPGTFNVTAAATDSNTPAHTATASILITVTAPAGLTAQFSFSPTKPVVGTLVSFKSSVSGGTAPYTYAWDFGDSVGTSTAANPTYTYSTAGTFTVTLTVTDTSGTKATTTRNITVSTSSGSTSGQYCTALTPGPTGGLEPIVSVDYVNPANSADYATTALFDSGAKYSLAPSSLATSLGLTLTDGTPVTLRSAGGTAVQAYVFHLTLNFGGTLHVVNVPVALTNSTDKFLIGKRGFLNQLSVTIDMTTQTICFTANSPNGGCTATAGVSEAHCGKIGTTGAISPNNNGTSPGVDYLEPFTVTSGTISGLPMLFALIPLLGLAAIVTRRLVSAPFKTNSKRRAKRSY